MSVSPQTTTTALLQGLHEAGNEAVWEEFHARYRPIILAVARRLGLSDDDAADVAQETLIRFVQEYRRGRYDRARGRLRAWIIGIARLRVADVYRAKARRRQYRGNSAIEGLPDDHAMSHIWEEECRSEILRQALMELREVTQLDERTIDAFEALVLREDAPAVVAEQQGMAIASVYKAKQRCLRQLREILVRLNRAYEVDL